MNFKTCPGGGIGRRVGLKIQWSFKGRESSNLSPGTPMGKKRKKKVVVIGGGTGVFVVLKSLRNLDCHPQAIISMADSGGSSGVLREEFGILPPGDVRRALIALADSDNKILAKLFNYRFREGKGLNGHNFGNLFLTVLQRITGNFQKAIQEAGKILQIKGEVIPVTLDNTHLVAQLENNQIIYGETHIDIPSHNPRLKIKKIWLQPPAKINPLAKRALEKAEAIILGPGDLYTSLLPNLVVQGVKKAIRKSRAKKIYIVNIMTKYGETNGFKASDFVAEVEKYLGKNVLDYILINIKKPSPFRLRKYRKEKAEFVVFDKEKFLKRKKQVILADLLREKGLVRHDFKKLASVLKKILFS